MKPQAAQAPRPKNAQPAANAVPAANPTLKEIVIKPREAEPPKAAPMTWFDLSYSAEKLMLSFRTRDSALRLDSRSPLVIQLDTEEPLEIEPSLITAENWPKSGDSMPLAVKGAVRNQDNAVVINASYRVCSSKTKRCQREKSQVMFQFKP
jgi:hypothetical protein